MQTLDAAELLSALGHESRLAVFRLLVEAGREGVHAGAIGEKLGLAGPTLSFHLAHLSRVGLITGRQVRRFIFYSANFPQMDELLSFLTSNCCQGNSCLPKTAGTGIVPVATIPGREKPPAPKAVRARAGRRRPAAT